MLTVDDALARVLEATHPLPPIACGLHQALGSRLAEDIRADEDAPPFDKALVDGYAVCSDCWQSGAATVRLRVIEHVPAGRVPSQRVLPGTASFVMTGAPLPPGADAMVMREYAELDGDDVLLSPPKPPTGGTHWMPRGRELTAGAVVAGASSRIDAVLQGVLASVGASRPVVYPRPRVTILSTGDELVSPEVKPGPGQIRNSNSVLLEGLVRQANADPTLLETAPDDPEILTNRLLEGLDPHQADLLLISGGVSAGTHDLVPGLLEDLGVQPIFHKIRMKPGKPLFFGLKLGVVPDRPILVFGLPGNPVSVLVGFINFVLPCLNRLGGAPDQPSQHPQGVLTSPFVHRGDRPTYFPCRIEHDPAGVRRVFPLAWNGSSDLVTLSKASALAVFPAGDRNYASGETISIVMIPGRN